MLTTTDVAVADYNRLWYLRPLGNYNALLIIMAKFQTFHFISRSWLLLLLLRLLWQLSRVNVCVRLYATAAAYECFLPFSFYSPLRHSHLSVSSVIIVLLFLSLLPSSLHLFPCTHLFPRNFCPYYSFHGVSFLCSKERAANAPCYFHHIFWAN